MGLEAVVQLLNFYKHAVVHSGLYTGAVCEPDVSLLQFTNLIHLLQSLNWSCNYLDCSQCSFEHPYTVSELLMSSLRFKCMSLWSMFNCIPHLFFFFFLFSFFIKLQHSYFTLSDNTIQEGTYPLIWWWQMANKWRVLAWDKYELAPQQRH